MRPRRLAASVVALAVVLGAVALRPGSPPSLVEGVAHPIDRQHPGVPPAPSPRPRAQDAVPALAEVNGLLADALGQLHVLCHLGEEHAHLQDHEVADGWFSRVTEARHGEARVSADGEALVSVRWEAGPDVTSATCEVVRATWGEVEVTVLDEDGTPAPGAVVAGCGATGETDAHGVATLQVVADAGSCTLHASDGADRDALHSLAPVAEHEQRAVTLRLRDARRPPSWLLGAAEVPAPAPDIDARIQRIEQALAADTAFLDALDAVGARASEAAQPVVERLRAERRLAIEAGRAAADAARKE